MSRYCHRTLGAEKLCFINIFCHRTVSVSSWNLFAASSEMAFILHICSYVWQNGICTANMYANACIVSCLEYFKLTVNWIFLAKLNLCALCMATKHWFLMPRPAKYPVAQRFAFFARNAQNERVVRTWCLSVRAIHLLTTAFKRNSVFITEGLHTSSVGHRVVISLEAPDFQRQ
jgi:hypothetical protein